MFVSVMLLHRSVGPYELGACLAFCCRCRCCACAATAADVVVLVRRHQRSPLAPCCNYKWASEWVYGSECECDRWREESRVSRVGVAHTDDEQDCVGYTVTYSHDRSQAHLEHLNSRRTSQPVSLPSCLSASPQNCHCLNVCQGSNHHNHLPSLKFLRLLPEEVLGLCCSLGFHWMLSVAKTES